MTNALSSEVIRQEVGPTLREQLDEYLADLITAPKPNIDQTQIAKADILKLRVSRPGCEAYFALPYNPYGRREDYAWSFGNQVFDMRHDPVVLIGEEFWDYIGGPGAFEALINVFEEVGEELRHRIQLEYLES